MGNQTNLGMRKRVLERDKGVCAKCGWDTLLEADIMNRELRQYPDQERFDVARNSWLLPMQMIENRPFTAIRPGWQADHVIPRCEGGPTTMENLRTLCLDCHARCHPNTRKAKRSK